MLLSEQLLEFSGGIRGHAEVIIGLLPVSKCNCLLLFNYYLSHMCFLGSSTQHLPFVGQRKGEKEFIQSFEVLSLYLPMQV